MRIGWVILVLAALVLGAGCGDDAPSSGPVTLVMSEMHNPDPDTAPFTGTGPFEVTEGADVLGCSTGTTADQGIVGEFEPAFDRVWTCESGDREGDFTARIELAGGDFEFWTWEITDATGDFADLQGSGDGESTSVTEDANGGIQWVDTYTGDIEYGS